MTVNAKRGRHPAHHLIEDFADLIGKPPPIGITEDDPVGPRLMGRPDRGQGILGIGFVSVKKMFGIVEDLGDMTLEMAHGVMNQSPIFLIRYPQGLLDMETP